MAIKYKWLASILKEQIQKNMKSGITKLPTENELSRQYHVSRQTVRQALALLQQERLVEKRHGSGTYLTGLLEDPSRNTVGILVPDTRAYLYPGLLADIHNTLSAGGFSEQVFETRNQMAKEREILTFLLENPPRGLIAEGCRSALPSPNLDLYRRLEKEGTSVLFLRNYYPALKDCFYITDDNYAGSATLVRHLASLGHRTIGCIFRSDDLQGYQCYHGYIETIRDCGLPLRHEHVCWYDTDDLEALENSQNTSFLRRMIQNKLSGCSVVICTNDEISYWLTRELLLAGYSLPEDISIATFDNMHLIRPEVPPVALLFHTPHEMGTKAAQMMMDKLKGLPVYSLEIPFHAAFS